jgi:hypothetical protein
VLAGPTDGGSDDRPLRGRPAASVVALPFAEGGLAAADVSLAATALRAKIAARMLHPQRRPWKVLAAAEFEAALPGLGLAAMLTSLPPAWAARFQGLPARLASCWAALRATRPHRLIALSPL